MATPRLGLVVEDKPTELSCIYMYIHIACMYLVYKVLPLSTSSHSCLTKYSDCHYFDLYCTTDQLLPIGR